MGSVGCARVPLVPPLGIPPPLAIGDAWHLDGGLGDAGAALLGYELHADASCGVPLERSRGFALWFLGLQHRAHPIGVRHLGRIANLYQYLCITSSRRPFLHFCTPRPLVKARSGGHFTNGHTPTRCERAVAAASWFLRWTSRRQLYNPPSRKVSDPCWTRLDWRERARLAPKGSLWSSQILKHRLRRGRKPGGTEWHGLTYDLSPLIVDRLMLTSPLSISDFQCASCYQL